MASGSKKKTKTVSSILEELDRLLYEGKWQDVQYSLRKMGKKKPLPPGLQPFVQALELIEDYTIADHRPSSPSRLVEEGERLLQSALDSCSDEEQGLFRVMIQIKQGQLAWIANETEKALDTLPQTSSARVDNAPLHTSKVLMEGSLYTGLCSEVFYQDSADQISLSVGAYEECLRLALDIINLSKTSGLIVHPSVFRAIRTSLERGPLLCIGAKDPLRCLGFYRRVLMAKEEYVLPKIRQICATSLALSLLFLVSPGSYCPFTFSTNTFTPSQLAEETVLVASIAKNFLGNLRDIKVQDATAMFDILTLVFTDARLPGLLVQVLEDSMLFMSSVSHLWLQFALALVNNGLHQQAEAVFYECVRLHPADPHIVLTASKFVLESLDKPELGLEWLRKRLKSFTGHFLEPRIYFVLAECQSALAEKENTFTKRQVLLKESLSSFEHAINLDPQNVEFEFRYSVQLATMREMTAAMKHVHTALAMSHDHSGCLHLLALLLSAQKQKTEALRACNLALAQDPHNLSLLKTKILLQAAVTGPQSALQTCKQAIKTWHKLFSAEETPGNAVGLIGAVAQDQCSLSDLQLKSIDREEYSFAMSPDVASDAGSSHFSLSTSPQQLNPAMVSQAGLWCTIASTFMSCQKYSDASHCVQEAQFLAPYLPEVSITNGRLLECEGQLDQALDQYNNALVLKPYNVTALTCMGRLLHLTGKNGSAEKHLKEALAVDKLCHEALYWLGKVFSAQNEHGRAADCFRTALQFESTCPVQRFEAALHRDNMLPL